MSEPSLFDFADDKPIDFWEVLSKTARKQAGLSDKWVVKTIESIANGTLCTLYQKIGVVTKGKYRGEDKLGSDTKQVMITRDEFQACRAEYDVLVEERKLQRANA